VLWLESQLGDLTAPHFPLGLLLACGPRNQVWVVVGSKGTQGLGGDTKACGACPPDSVLASLPVEPWPDQQARLVLKDQARVFPSLARAQSPGCSSILLPGMVYPGWSLSEVRAALKSRLQTGPCARSWREGQRTRRESSRKLALEG